MPGESQRTRGRSDEIIAQYGSDQKSYLIKFQFPYRGPTDRVLDLNLDVHSMRWTQLLFLLASGLSCSLGATLQFPLHHEYNPSGSPPHPAAHLASPVTLQTRETVVYRPSSYKELLEARLRSIHLSESQPIQWIPTKVLAPDVQDMHTLSQLARMSGDAYALQGKKNWYELDPSWNTVRYVYSSGDISQLI